MIEPVVDYSLGKFIEDNRDRRMAKNEWLVSGPMRVYVRYPAKHWCNGQLLTTFDVANINVEPAFRGMGKFTRFLDQLETSGVTVYVENVVNDGLAVFLFNRGYLRAKPEGIDRSFYKEKSKS